LGNFRLRGSSSTAPSSTAPLAHWRFPQLRAEQIGLNRSRNRVLSQPLWQVAEG
jgi:hypothetical protein